MSVTRNVTVDDGVASIGAGEFLAFRLLPGPGNPMWVFACEDRNSILAVSDDPQAEYRWYLGDVPASINDGPHFSLDRGVNNLDVYVLEMLFPQCATYSLEIVQLPANKVKTDITFTSNDATDSFPEPFSVRLI